VITGQKDKSQIRRTLQTRKRTEPSARPSHKKTAFAQRFGNCIQTKNRSSTLRCGSNLYGQHNKNRAPMEPLQWKDVNLDEAGFGDEFRHLA
jgi:hypothetical protein